MIAVPHALMHSAAAIARGVDHRGARWLLRVAAADDGGWEIRVEVNGRLVAREHYDDWHRVERHCAMLEEIWRAR